jgi:hypothetical protein
MRAEQISARLRGRIVGPGRYLTHCPVPGHGKGRGDRNPSLSIWQREDGGVGVKCFTGCDPREIYAELRRLGLAPDEADKRRQPWLVNGQGGRQRSMPEVKAAYDYCNEQGERLYQVVRTEPKGFFQKRPDGRGGWINNLDGVRRVLYRLPELLEAVAEKRPIFFVEGEKDVENLRGFGVPATTSGNANSWRPEFAETFRSGDVILVPDNDEVGRKFVQSVAASLTAAGATRIRVLDLPGLRPAGDVSDWIAAGGTIEQLWKLVDQAPDWAPPNEPLEHHRRHESAGWRDGLVNAQDLCDREFPEIKFVIPGLFPEGVTLLASRPKLGKSWLLLQIAGAVAKGVATLAFDDRPPMQGDVLYLALEDNQKRLQRRLRKLYGSDQENWPAITLATSWRRLDCGGLDALREWCKSVARPLLIEIDTLKRVRPPKRSKQTDYDADYEACQGLQQLASEFDIAIIVAHHDRKMDAEDVFDTVSGTLGLTGGVDTVAIIKRRGSAFTLHIEGRDLSEPVEKAVQLDRETCLWVILGEAAEVLRSNERARVLTTLKGEPEGLSVAEIAARASLASRNAADVILGRMTRDGEVERFKRGRYRLPRTPAAPS